MREGDARSYGPMRKQRLRTAVSNAENVTTSTVVSTAETVAASIAAGTINAWLRPWRTMRVGMLQGCTDSKCRNEQFG